MALWLKRCMISIIASAILYVPVQAQNIPSPLTQGDVTTYKTIFRAQEQGHWHAADAYITRLESRLLMGYVLSQRYLHPTAYNATYAELKHWLDLYADHPNARAIFALAKKRQPSGSAAPTPYQPRKWRTALEHKKSPAFVAAYKNARYPQKARSIAAHVQNLCHKNRPDAALSYLSNSLQRPHLPPLLFNQMRATIAAAYYYNGQLDKARALALTVTQHSSDHVVLAHWIAGLLEWRTGHYDAAYRHFNAMAHIPYQPNRMRAAAAFWAARAGLRQGYAQDVTAHLAQASQYPFTFYGQLALAMQGQHLMAHWRTVPTLTPTLWAQLTLHTQRPLRAAALAQVSQYKDAHTELRWAHGELRKEDDTALMAAAFALNLWAAQLDIAVASGAGVSQLPNLVTGLYPLPDFTPNGGFELDRALLFGLMRQESKFMPQATSRAGARGLMQLMPRTASYISGDPTLQSTTNLSRLYHPGYNMQLGQSYISYLLTREAGGNLFDLVIAYNWGPGNLRRWKAKTAIADPLLRLESIPNAQARNFVTHVMANIWVYRSRLGQPAPSRDNAAAGHPPLYQALDTSSPSISRQVFQQETESILSHHRTNIGL